MKKTLICLQALWLISFAGCNQNEDGAEIIDSAVPGMNFAIVSPQNNALVSQRSNLEVQGVGMRKNPGITSFRCSVHTDQWYEQSGAYDVSNNGSWRTWVNLGGTGQYNNHIIRVQIIYANGIVDTAEVTGIVVQE